MKPGGEVRFYWVSDNGERVVDITDTVPAVTIFDSDPDADPVAIVDISPEVP